MGLDYILSKNPKIIEGIDLQVYNMNDNIIFLKDVFEKIFEPDKGDTVKLGELTGLRDMGVTEMKLSDIMDITEINLGMETKKGEGQPKISCEDKVDQYDTIQDTQIKDIQDKNTKNDQILSPKMEVNFPFKSDSSQKNKKMSFSSDYESISPFDFEKMSDYIEFLQKNEISKPILLCLNTMLGLNEIDNCHESFLKSLFDLDCFIGMLGGKEYKAFYFFGHCKKFFYYLDPHYVKAAHGPEYSDEEYIKDYFIKTIFKMKFKNIAPSLSVCFLIQSSQGFLFIFKFYIFMLSFEILIFILLKLYYF